MDIDIIQPRQICGRPSGIQMRALLDELEAHPHLARGRTRGPDIRQTSDSLWRQISHRLNNLDGCSKSHKQWQKFWADKKSAVKKQVAARQSEGISVSAAVFTDIELRIISLIERTESDQNDVPSKSTEDELVNQDEYAMSDSDNIEEENPLIETPIEAEFMYEVKHEPYTERKTKVHQRKIFSLPSRKKKPQQNINRAKLMKQFMRLEKRRTETEEKTATTLASIAACMKRQEESTQRLTSVLLQLIPQDGLITFKPRIQCSPPSEEQVNALLDQLESNRHLALGRLRRQSTPIWDGIARKLNRMNGCKKTVKQWMKYWSDKKVGVKRMLEAAKTSAGDNDIDYFSAFSNIEKRVSVLLENTNFVDAEASLTLPYSPSMETEYLEAEDYLSDVNEEKILEVLDHPFISVNIDSKSFPLKLDPDTMKPSLRSSTIQKSKQRQVRKVRGQPVSPTEMWQKLLRMEERRVAAQETIANTLSEIETSMRRQEEATRELARVLIRMLR